jgi:hypothetical protein
MYSSAICLMRLVMGNACLALSGFRAGVREQRWRRLGHGQGVGEFATNKTNIQIGVEAMYR